MATPPETDPADAGPLPPAAAAFLPSSIALDLGIEAGSIRVTGSGGAPCPRVLLGDADSEPDAPLHTLIDEGEFSESDPLLVVVPGRPDDRRLARWRDALWPGWHVVALYELDGKRTRRRTMHGVSDLGTAAERGVVLAARRTAHVMSPAATVEKFDQNAKGWDGEPGTPGYAHHRWMRKYVADFAAIPRNSRLLDFGCGAGWVGIEAARRSQSSLCSFDPSPEMVRITGENAAAEGVTNFTGRTGFGEAPPFPGEGEEPFDVVISSGVISFSPDVDRWLDGLAATVRPGGTLIIGDIHGGSLGFWLRRRSKPLLPVRELNAQDPDEVRAQLEARGFSYHAIGGYQLTFPIPEAMHVDTRKLGGVLSPLFLLLNKAGAALDRSLGHVLAPCFDSWVMCFTRDHS